MVYLTCLVLIVTLTLGGSTRVGYVGDAVVQVFALTLLGAALFNITSFQRDQFMPDWRLPLIYSLILLPVALALYLVPLPDEIGRQLTLAEPASPVSHNGPRPVSIAPHLSWAAALSLVVPIAMFVAIVQMSQKQRFAVVFVIVLFGAASAALGLAQIAAGPETELRFFDFTNTSEAVGFFANRNHFAALLYSCLVFSCFLFWSRGSSGWRSENRDRSAALIWTSLAIATLVLICVGLAMARSRAGLFLTLAALLGSALLVLLDRNKVYSNRNQSSSAFGIRQISVFVVFVAAGFAANFAAYRYISRFERDPLEDLRWPLAETTLSIASSAWPLGAGPGVFVPAYAAHEKTTDLFAGYANRAHNDFAELLLEMGVVGALLLAAFLIWFLTRLAVWFPSKLPGDNNLQRAATIVVMLLLAHSLVDYPLRTSALAALFACACAFLLPPPLIRGERESEDADISLDNEGARLPSAQPAPTTPFGEATVFGQFDTAPQQPTDRDPLSSRSQDFGSNLSATSDAHIETRLWGSDLEWPDAWKTGKEGDKTAKN